MREIVNSMRKKLKEYEELQLRIQNSLKDAPIGGLRVSMRDGYPRYYNCTGKGDALGNYICKSDLQLAQQLAQKEYDQKVMKELTKIIKWIRQVVDASPYNSLNDIWEQMHPAKKSFIHPYTLSDEEYRKQWEGITYVGKSFDEAISEIYTDRGERVRSKSEKIIADKLNSMKIPYRYEYPLKLSGFGTVYPDFTILNLRTRKEYYFEHFGMMDKPEYASNAIQKLETYQRNGIYPGEKLLITYETSEMMCDMRLVQCLFEKYLL